MDGSEVMEIMRGIDFRMSGYLSIMGDSSDCIEEFINNYDEDIAYIKKLIKDGYYNGIIKTKIDTFQSFLMNIPSQMLAMIQLRGIYEKTK